MQFMYAVCFYGREEHNRYNIDFLVSSLQTIEHYQADLENNLVQGSKAFVKNSFRTAVNDYTLAVILLETNSLKVTSINCSV